MSDMIQAERLLRIESSLGFDTLLAERFSGTEMVNGLFEFQVAVRAKRDDLKPEEIVGERVDVSLDRGFGRRRKWNGLVTHLDEEPRLSRGLRQYVLTLRPDLWLLGQKSDCRIWQNRSSVEVVETLLSEHGLTAPDTVGVQSPPAAHEYDVQWNETDLSYLLRRIEEDGIHYWIRQEEDGQRLVLADAAAGWDKGPDGEDGQARFSFGSTDENHVTSWRRRFSFTPGKRAGRDWNFETPTSVPGAETPSTVKLPKNGAYELYEYPARALDTASNERASKLRMQSVEADHEAHAGASTVRELAPGARLTPFDVADPTNRFETAVVLSVTHRAVDPSYDANSGEPSYENAFTALPARLPATPHRATRRPRIEGSQIAVIAGPEGEEIHTDQYGRVKLWFPWDRRAKRDGSDTRWVRVAQPWAGGSWGSQVIPRIGMEAVVSFEGGDPDRPIVTALVPNPQNSVPYELPANKSRMTLRSNTHKGEGFNELSMEDEAGKEQVFLHAQKDFDNHVLNDTRERIEHDRHQHVGHDKTSFVGGDHEEVISGNVSIAVGRNHLTDFLMSRTQNIFGRFSDFAEKLRIPDPFNFAKGNFQLFVEKSKSEVVNGGSSEVVGVAKSTVVGNLYQVTVGKKMSLIVRGRYDEDIGRIRNINVGEQLTIRVGPHTMISMSREGDIVVKAKRIKFKADQIDGN